MACSATTKYSSETIASPEHNWNESGGVTKKHEEYNKQKDWNHPRLINPNWVVIFGEKAATCTIRECLSKTNKGSLKGLLSPEES